MLLVLKKVCGNVQVLVIKSNTLKNNLHTIRDCAECMYESDLLRKKHFIDNKCILSLQSENCD